MCNGPMLSPSTQRYSILHHPHFGLAVQVLQPEYASHSEEIAGSS